MANAFQNQPITFVLTDDDGHAVITDRADISKALADAHAEDRPRVVNLLDHVSTIYDAIADLRDGEPDAVSVMVNIHMRDTAPSKAVA